ncbi:RraA family protein [Pelomonas sp. CA6]|uniref:RraA family protein n=1 Tax=Pelomonas sp. CA6 TaxID=2907999 RepID=UPI001F4C3536|nr:RraA family protein [Pelomonas sp. CA6]MCH7343436.1 RraA family protein [Pelomonas sp. CA6]
MRSAYWGELLTVTARMRGANGAVIDGYHRDTPMVLAQQWPVFSRGAFGQDSAVRTGIVDFRCEIELGGVWIRPGDLVFGDMDGVVVVPRACEDEVLRRALDKVGSENRVRQAIEAGMSSTEALARFKVL